MIFGRVNKLFQRSLTSCKKDFLIFNLLVSTKKRTFFYFFFFFQIQLTCELRYLGQVHAL